MCLCKWFCRMKDLAQVEHSKGLMPRWARLCSSKRILLEKVCSHISQEWGRILAWTAFVWSVSWPLREYAFWQILQTNFFSWECTHIWCETRWLFLVKHLSQKSHLCGLSTAWTIWWLMRELFFEKDFLHKRQGNAGCAKCSISWLSSSTLLE